MNAIPLVEPHIDWEVYMKSAKQVLGRSMTAELDKRNMTLDAYGFLTALKEMKHEGTDPNSVAFAHHPMSLHLTYSFIFILSRSAFYELLESGSLSVHSQTCRDDYKFCVVTGTLSSWFDNINKFRQLDNTLGDAFNAAKLYFERNNLLLWKKSQKLLGS